MPHVDAQACMQTCVHTNMYSTQTNNFKGLKTSVTVVITVIPAVEEHVKARRYTRPSSAT